MYEIKIKTQNIYDSSIPFYVSPHISHSIWISGQQRCCTCIYVRGLPGSENLPDQVLVFFESRAVQHLRHTAHIDTYNLFTSICIANPCNMHIKKDKQVNTNSQIVSNHFTAAPIVQILLNFSMQIGQNRSRALAELSEQACSKWSEMLPSRSLSSLTFNKAL